MWLHSFDILIASADDARAICMDTEGSKFKYNTIEELHHFCLFLLLGIFEKSTDIGELGKQFEFLAAHSGQAVYLIPEILIRRLASLNPDEVSKLTDRWFKLDTIQSMEVKRATLKRALATLCKLSAKSRKENLPLLLRY